MPISIFRAGETITPGNIVAVTQNSVIKKASVNDPETFRAIGVATTSGYAGDAVKVVVDDQVHIFSGLTPGNQLYLSPTPGLYTTSYTTITSGVGVSLNGSANLAPFARAISASGIALQTPAPVVADVSSESITLENTPSTNIFNFFTESGFNVVKESSSETYVSDPDAAIYIAAVETADGQQLEKKVKVAIDNFVLGCKEDGIWTAIKASCILAGARTLNGCLVPLIGAAPTNNNFVSGDYNRKTGLAGDASTKNLNSNRANNADPQDSQHIATYVSSSASGPNRVFAGSDPIATTGALQITAGSSGLSTASRGSGAYVTAVSGQSYTTGLKAISRSDSSGFTVRAGGASIFRGATSNTPTSTNIFIFDRGPTPPHVPSDARLSFYSIGESLDLAKLDARVTTLMNDFAAAIP